MKRTFALLPLLLTVSVFAQDASDPWQGFLANLKPRTIGPTNMGGRCVDLAVYEKEPRIFYVASASGGLWKTTNAGTTMQPVFDKEGSVSIGAAAVSQNSPDLVWVGTGEGTSRNSVAWGDGVYKSTDGGKTWANMGLKETMHISRILIDPRNDNTVYVGALGRLWGTNAERGVYKTVDGGKSWNLVFKIDEKTGVADMQMNPKNPNEILCAMWPRDRKPYDFISGGPTAGLYKTTDGGRNWKKITRGLPTGELGRIGLSYYRKDPKVVMATVEYVPPKDEKVMGQTATMNRGGTFLSKDGGESWERINSLNPRPFYFSRPVVDPNDMNRMYINAVNLHISDDAGKTFRTARASIHADNHQLWINPRDSFHMIIANDGGTYQSFDKGVTWSHINNMPIGQFYAIAFDMRTPYWVYGGLQDNGSWGMPTQSTRDAVSWYDVVGLGGGDGFHVQSDPNDWRWFYSESQGGGIVRYDLKSGQARGIRPSGQGLRFNWSTPFILSPHNTSTLYLGANKLFKSVNRGASWKAISEDLTTNDKAKQNPTEKTGAEMHCTIVTVSESPRKQGLLYVGTDDGLVWVTQDDGATWSNITANIPDLPKFTWCSRVLASKYEDGRVYATFDGHRLNDFKSYAYVSEDYGKTWTKLSNGLPEFDSLYVIIEGEKNPDLLFLGSEMGLRVSLDRGKSWSRFRTDFPTVAVHDLKIHPREGDLIIGTHGRSIWTLDVNGLEAMTSSNRDKDVVLAKPQNVYLLGYVTGTPWDGDQVYTARNTQPGTQIQYFLKTAQPADVTIKIMSADGERVQEIKGSGKAGLNTVRWDGRVMGRRQAGDYRVTMTVGGKEYATSVNVIDVSGN